MSDFADRMAQLALQQINSYGRMVTYRRPNLMVYDPTSGVNIYTTSDTIVRGVLTEATDDFDPILIRHGDRELLLAGQSLTLAPRPGDQILIDTQQYSIVSLKITWAQDRAVLYRLLIRA